MQTGTDDRLYVSEFERFMQAYLDHHPDVVADQRCGWSIWWDHRVDLDELDRQRASEVPFKPYA